MPSLDLTYLVPSLEDNAAEQIKSTSHSLQITLRASQAILNDLHGAETEGVDTILNTLDGPEYIPRIKEKLKELAELIPKNQFYRYHSLDSLSRNLQTSYLIVIQRHFLQNNLELLSKEQVEQKLGFEPSWKDSLILTTEDYLHSVLTLVSELSRLSINRVTQGDYQSAVEFSRFSKELQSAFSVLNLKNDSLRKHFDSLKWEVKKLEEIVYDLSLRGLLQKKRTLDDSPDEAIKKSKSA